VVWSYAKKKKSRRYKRGRERGVELNIGAEKSRVLNEIRMVGGRSTERGNVKVTKEGTPGKLKGGLRLETPEKKEYQY